MVCISGPEVVNNGLILHLDAANSRSYPGTGTTWTDLSGAGNNGTLVNSIAYSAANKGVMTYDGIDDYVSVPSLPITTQLTASAFVSISSNRTTQPIIGNWTSNDTASWFILASGTSANYGVSLFARNSAGVLYSALSGTILSLNTYYYITFVFNEGLALLYINGILVGGIPIGTTTLFQNSLPIWIGRILSFYSTGSTSQITVYNRALTVAEIKQNFEATRGRYNV